MERSVVNPSARRHVFAIVNPAAGGGLAKRTRTSVEDALRRVFPRVEVATTTAGGHATRLARSALEQGAELIVAVGGDGTASEVLGGWFDPQGALRFPAAELGIVHTGSGGDYLRMVAGWPRDPARQVEQLAQRSATPVDVGLADFGVGPSRAEPCVRPFLNTASVGVSSRVLSRLRGGRALGGLSYAWASVAALVGHAPMRLAVAIGAQPVADREVDLLVVANGRYFGAGMHIAPGAAVDDGRLEVIGAFGLSRVALLGLLPRLYRGTHVGHPAVETRPATVVVVDRPSEGASPSDEPFPGFEVDGELVGHLPARFTLAAGRVLVRPCGVSGRAP